jgi:hypothetical protein
MKFRRWTIAMVVCLMPLVLAAPSLAHSTKGRIRIPLEKVALTIDDVAYFCESYVHREFYRDRFEPNQRRFYVKAFMRIDQEGPVATVHFLTLDVKEKRDFPDQMQIRRGADGVWTYTPAAGGEPVPLYTYVTKWGHYYQTYILPLSAAGIVLAAAVFGLLRFGRRRRRPAEEG